MNDLSKVKKVKFQEIELNVHPDKDYEWFLSSKEVAECYGVSDSVIRDHKRNHKDELVYGKHFIMVYQNEVLPSVENIDAEQVRLSNTYWTKKGIVRLGFFIKSKIAIQFRDWAEDYIINPENLTDISKITKTDLAKMIIESEEERIKLEAENKLLGNKVEEDKPKVNAWNDFLDTNMTMSMSEVAKVLCNRHKTGRTRLFQFLRDKRILQTGGRNHNVPEQKYIDAGYFKLRENKIMKSEGWAEYKPQTLVTPKGFEFIDKQLTKDREIEDSENILKFESKGI